MRRGFFAALMSVVAAALLTASPASAQIASPAWGEPISTLDRFVLLASYNNEAVHDRETGLVWEQSPSLATGVWSTAQYSCNKKTVGNRKGWRLPAVQELATLIDPSVPYPGPTLPAGHPFDPNALASYYWSATTRGGADLSGDAWSVSLLNGDVAPYAKFANIAAWCVRGGPATWNP